MRNFILNQIKVKSIGDIPLSGTDYISVAAKYVEAINEGAVPKIEDAWAAVVESQLSEGFERALKSYEADMKQFEEESVPCNEDELEKAHKGIMQAAIDIFLEITKGFDNQEKQEAYDQLQNKIEETYSSMKEYNDAENENKLSGVINDLYRSEILTKEFKTLHDYMEGWRQFYAAFMQQSDSFKKFEVWSEFSIDHMQDGVARINKKLDAKKELKEKQLELEYNKLKTEFELKQSDTSKVDSLKRELHSLKNEKVDAQHKEQELKREVVS